MGWKFCGEASFHTVLDELRKVTEPVPFHKISTRWNYGILRSDNNNNDVKEDSPTKVKVPAIMSGGDYCPENVIMDSSQETMMKFLFGNREKLLILFRSTLLKSKRRWYLTENKNKH